MLLLLLIAEEAADQRLHGLRPRLLPARPAGLRGGVCEAAELPRDHRREAVKQSQQLVRQPRRLR